MMKYLLSNNLMSDFQSAYRPRYSTTTALLNICDDIRRGFDLGQFTVLALLDFSKAFDSVNHSKLCDKLENLFNFSESACKLIFSYLCGRSQRVEVNGVLSDMLQLKCGVPQGSVLGPLLFSVFINDISSCFLYTKFHLYADDLQVYKVGSDLECDQMIFGVLRLGQYAMHYCLMLKKTQAIICHRNRLMLCALID